MNDTDINAFNLKIRQTPWYQEWFAQRGLNPNQVKLNDQQRQELKSLVEQHTGFTLPGDMKIDPAGNLNEKGGWAGLPTAVKIGIIGAAAAATGGALGVFGGGAGVGAGGTGAGLSAAAGAPTAASTGVGLAGAGTTGLGLSVSGSAAAPGIMGRIAGVLRSPIATAAGRMISGAGQASAQNRGVEMEARLAHDQMNLLAQRERRDAETDAYRKSLYGQLATSYAPSQRPAGAEGRYSEGFTSQGARDAGQLMYDTAMKRMREQDYPGITPYNQLPTRPGVMERIATYAAPALSLFDPRLYDGDANGR